MAGIFSQGGSAGHRYAGWLSEVEAKNFIFGGKVFNGSPSAIYVGSNLVWAPWLLKDAAIRAILGAFGQRDGMAVINATNAYLTQLAASDRDKATALAGFINEDPMMVCSLGLQVQGVTMPIRWLKKSATSNYFDLGVKLNGATTGVRVTYILSDFNFGNDTSIFGARQGYGSSDYSINFGAWSFGTFYIGYGINHSEPTVPRNYTPNVVSINKGLVKVNEWSKNYGVRSFNPSGNAWLFSSNNLGDNHPCRPACRISECYMTENNIESHWFVPFMDGEQIRLRDITTGNYATTIGSFTIEYTLPDGTPWTPSTP